MAVNGLPNTVATLPPKKPPAPVEYEIEWVVDERLEEEKSLLPPAGNRTALP